ncbi:MAG TPA: hypothetical protein VJ463_05930 [Geothrix sp.]|nr:hypothetical protein [Geothrix sp.]
MVHKGNAQAIRFNGTLGLRQLGVEFHDFEDLRVEFQLMAKNL